MVQSSKKLKIGPIQEVSCETQEEAEQSNRQSQTIATDKKQIIMDGAANILNTESLLFAPKPKNDFNLVNKFSGKFMDVHFKKIEEDSKESKEKKEKDDGSYEM